MAAQKCKALWYGGANYAPPNPERDLEEFDSLKAAKQAFLNRADFDPYYPCVDRELTEMHIYFDEYSEDGPDLVLFLGPKGGIRVER